MKQSLYVTALTIMVIFWVCSCQKDSAGSDSEVLVGEIRQDISETELQADVEKLVSFGTRNSYSAKNSKTRGIGAAQAWLQEKFTSLGSGDRWQVFFDCFEVSGHNLCNIGAIWKGTVSPEKYFVISGHYDSMPANSRDGNSDAPGADDDASGTAVVLEAARVLAKRDLPISVVFLATVGEEQGLLGARHFAALLKRKGFNVVGMITNDIVGSSDGSEGSAPHRLRVYSDWNAKYTRQSKALAERVRLAVAQGTENRFTLDLKPAIDRRGRSGDHVAFLEQGFPAIRFIEPYEDLRHQHQNVGSGRGDLPVYLEYDYMARVVLANVLAILSIQ